MSAQLESAVIALSNSYPHYAEYISLSLEAFYRGQWNEEELLDNILDAFPIGGNA